MFGNKLSNMPGKRRKAYTTIEWSKFRGMYGEGRRVEGRKVRCAIKLEKKEVT
jgi:hypothetical protein